MSDRDSRAREAIDKMARIRADEAAANGKPIDQHKERQRIAERMEQLDRKNSDKKGR
jgi:hypothetical protein